jgi:hypothetical protein
MFISITSIELKSIWHFFKLSRLALGITIQTKKSAGFKHFKKTGLGRLHYTLTVWESKEDMHNFYKNGAHLNGMKQAASIAKEIGSYSYEAEKLPDWKTAKSLLKEKGKFVHY